MALFARLVRSLRHRPRLLASALVGTLVVMALPQVLATRDVTRWLIGWNAGAWTYLLLAGAMMVRSSPERMRRRALTQDDGAAAILTLVVLAALAGLGAIVAELGVARDEHGLARQLHIGLAALTVVSSWAFTQLMFALHYAHEFYLAQQRESLDAMRAAATLKKLGFENTHVLAGGLGAWREANLPVEKSA